MKFFIVLSALVVLAAASPKVNVASMPDLQEILESIYHPNTDPATAQLLLDMLLEQLGYTKPDIGPAIIDFDPADVAPALPVSPAIPVSPASPARISPLVQIIVNVAKPAPAEGDQAPADDVQIADSDDVTPVEIADLPPPPAPPVSDVVIGDLPAPPVSDVVIGDLPAPPVSDVVVGDLPAPPVSGVAVGAPHQPSPAIN